MITPEKSTEIANERKSRRFWVLLILAFFSMDIAIATIAIFMATRDPSFRPMPDYGDQNVSWEERHQERLQSSKLGWTVNISPVEPTRDAMTISAKDRFGNPVTGASGILSAYHFTRVTELTRSKMVEVAPGQYESAIDCSRNGMWKIELRLDNGDQHFLYENAVEFPRNDLGAS